MSDLVATHMHTMRRKGGNFGSNLDTRIRSPHKPTTML